MDQSLDSSLRAAVRRGLLAAAALAIPAAGFAQQRGAESCYAGVPGADAALAAGPAAGDPNAARTADAERALALRDLEAGNAFAAIERLERAGIAGARADAALALAYARVGCRAALLSRSSDTAGLPPALAAELRARHAVATAVARDSVPAGTVPLVAGSGDVVTAGVREAWAAYERQDYGAAERAFGAAAGATPDIGERLELRLLAAQAALEAGASQRAAAGFRAILDSARALDALVVPRLDSSAPSVLALAAAATERRAVGLLWASEAAAGRLAAMDGDGTLRLVTRSQVDTGFAVLGPSAADPVARALAWTPGGSGLADLRAAADALGEADARLARATARIARLDRERSVRLASVARYVATVRGMSDSLAAAARELAALSDSVAHRDSAIARTIEDYRRLIERKIADTRALARENRARIDSLAPAARAAGALTARFLEAEQGTAAGYLAVADAAEEGLERGLARLDIVFQRDAVHARRDRLAATLRDARAAFDTSLASALADSTGLTASLDRVRAAAEAELAAARTAQSEVERKTSAQAAAALASRAAALRDRLARTIERAAHGAAAALFFAALEADTLRADASDVARRRDAAVAAATDALTAWPRSRLRPAVLQQAGELLTRRADADYAAAQRSGGATAPERPDYGPAIARFDELVREFPDDPRADAAAYTLGILAFASQRYDDATRAFGFVENRSDSQYRAEAYFRDGDGRFEQASRLAGDERRARFADAARAYEQAIVLAPAGGDVYFLSLYKLGWSDYMQAERQSSDEYRRAVDVFARLVREVDSLPPERQARLALRQEAIDYLAIAITQLGGPDEAVRYLGSIPDVGTRMLVLRRVAHALRDQGEFKSAIVAFRGALDQAPLHPAVLETRVELVDLLQSRMLEPAAAQAARLELVDALAPGGAWAAANAGRARDAAAAREKALREAGAWELSAARSRAAEGSYATAARIFARYLAEFSASDSAARVSALEGDARFGAHDYFAAGVAYARTASQWPGDSALAAVARRNAVVAFDSALVSARRGAIAGTGGGGGASAAPTTAAIEDSLFAATERFVEGAAPGEARAALAAMGRRASEVRRWDVVASAFRRIAERWPDDPGVADARRFVADARYRQGRYADAQAEWERAQAAATAAGRRGLADSIVAVRVAAAAQVADSLARRGAFVAAADSILAPLADRIGNPARSADLLRNAIEVHLAADSAARASGDSAASHAARLRAIGAIEALVARFPGYEHATTYGALRARLLSDVGRPADAAAALEALATANPKWPGRTDAMVRAAVLLDSVGRSAEAAAAYEKFSEAYPADRRAPDALYNAAVIRRDANDAAGAARTFLAFVTRFPRDPRVGEANAARLAALRVAGDTASIGAELARLCARPAPAMVATCADRTGALAFAAGMARWDAYIALRLEIKSRAQLTRAGVDAAAAPKLQAFRAITRSFTQAIASGAPTWVAAGSFQTGLAQWYYGLFLRDVTLPADLTDAQRTGAQQGAAQQAQQYFDLAIKTWTALVEKAGADKFDNAWVARARAALRGEGIPPREKSP